MTDDIVELGLSPSGRARRRLEQLSLAWRSCVDCALARSRQHVVSYRGSPTAPIALVGEAPGQEEDLRGVPFVGPSGRVVNDLLLEAKVSFDDVFFVNMVGCRPPADRAPSHEELLACESRALDMLRTVEPIALIMFGVAAAKLAAVTSIGPWRGKPLRVELGNGRSCRGVVTYHPSFLIRQGGDQRFRRRMLSDIKVARAIAHKDSRNALLRR